ncbi:molybdopterin-containing oxidoreductase family protein, partial [Ellagibacter isourolithinifaciens]
VERINKYSYEEIEKLTQVPTEQMRTVARAYATADGTGRNCSIFMGVAMEMQTDALSDIQAVLSLIAITGNVDVPGGNVLGPKASFTGAWRYEQIKWVAEKEKQSRIGNDREPIERNALSNVQSDAILPELELPDDQRTVHMIWFNSCNALVCMPAEPQRWINACQKMDFNVVQDLFMTPTAMALCDLFLPVSTFIEHDGVVQIHYGRHTPYLGAEVKAIDYGETKSDLEVTFELGKRLNPEAWAEYETIEDFMDNQIEPTGMTFDELRHKGILSFNGWNYRKYETGELRSDGQPGFNTVTGMIELYSLQLESWGEEPLPMIEPVPFSKESNPEMAEKYPIILTTGGRKWTQFHSEWRQVKGMREIDPWPVLTVNPETAKEYGISEGDWAEVFNDTGKARLKVKVSPVIKPGMVHATHAWWFPEQDGEAPNYFGAFKSNINTLLPNDSCGRMYKGSPYKSNMCNIRRVTGLDD